MPAEDLFFFLWHISHACQRYSLRLETFINSKAKHKRISFSKAGEHFRQAIYAVVRFYAALLGLFVTFFRRLSGKSFYYIRPGLFPARALFSQRLNAIP